MRYSYSALVLATLTIASVAAGPVRHGHAHFHAKKDAEPLKVEANAEKREAQGWEDIDWSTVKITYSAGQTWGQPTPAAAVAAAPAATTTAAAAAAPAATKAASSSKAAASSKATAVAGIDSTTVLAASDLAKLTSLGCQKGTNAVSNNGGVWIGTDGPYVHEFINGAGEDIIVVVWGSWGSWVNTQTPLITHSLAAGESTHVSFASGSVGAFSAIYSDTQMVDGQISNTWGEYTHSVEGVVDVSREVNMNGHTLEIVGPSCTTNMDTCVFVCSSGDVCITGYELLNCDNGSQTGANYGEFEGSPSGGCGGMGSSASFKTTFS